MRTATTPNPPLNLNWQATGVSSAPWADTSPDSATNAPPSSGEPTPAPPSSSEPTIAPLTLTDSDLTALPELTPGLRIQPPSELALINRPVILYATTPAEPITAEVRGHAVTIRPTPVRYTWRFGDTEQITDHPGAPYPNHTVHHTFRAAGPQDFSLTITWRVAYRTDEGEWRDHPRLVHTRSPEQHRELISLDNRLVSE